MANLGIIQFTDPHGRRRTANLDKALMGIITLARPGHHTSWYNAYHQLPAEIQKKAPVRAAEFVDQKSTGEVDFKDQAPFEDDLPF